MHYIYMYVSDVLDARQWCGKHGCTHENSELGTHRVHACIMRQLVLWDIHTNKYGSFQFGGQCIVLYEICYLIS